MSSVFLPPDKTRLVTICAHVDHGKTTLADNLIESNGIISERHAGTLRYLDSTEEEQRRGITMRASAIGLRHRYTPSNAGAAKKQQEQQQQQQEGGSSSSSSSSSSPIIVHLLDSPGHTDFSTEVSSSLQCCDGCLLVVDAVEGMCARTHQVVREAHSHQLVPILIINKVDRLCTDLCLTPTEAYIRLRSLIESVNAACAAMLVSKRAKRREDERVLNKKSGLLSKGDSNNWTFDAQRGNVVFASALFGWGFTVPSLARSLFRNKILPIKPIMLKQYLFGDFYFKQQSSNSSNSNTDGSTGKMMKLKVTVENQNQLPLFAEYGLQPLWEIYEGVAAAAAYCGLGSNIFSDGRIPATTTFNNRSKGKIEIKATTPGMDQVLQAMQAGSTMPESATSAADITSLDNLQQVMTRTGSSTSEEAVLRSLLRRYRPLGDIVLNSVYEICPSPIQAAEDVRPRALAIMDSKESDDDRKNDDDEEKEKELVGCADENNHEEEFTRIKVAIRSCDVSNDAPAVAYVCKFMAADRSQIRDPGRIDDENDETSSTVILGLARVLSGRLKTSSTYHVMGPKHKFNDPNIIRSRPIRLFLLMGSSFVLVDEVPAGHLCAIQNLEDVQYKTATISDSPYGMPLLGFADMIQRPLVKVNVEAIDPADTYTLERGLVKLSLADAAVEVTATAKGERIVACLGELHLEQSILDLQNIYCDKKGVQLRISEPIVEFGETTAWFDDNELDFEGFLSESRKQVPPLRQLTIPPYNEEEGIEFSQRGRARSIVSGRVGAVSMRVVPLDPMIYEALKGGDVDEDCSDAINKLGRALGFPKDQNAESILKALADTVISVDDSGNAIVASSALESGTTVAGVISEKDEIYVPNKLELGASAQSLEEDNGESKNDVCGLLEYEMVQREIRDNGFLLNDAEKRKITSVDTAALEIWRSQMKGSLIAGFQMAMRAGPICEEPVRSVLVILEGLEVALKEDKRSENEFKTASPLSGGMMAAALRIGIRSALL
jgi:ribosome assembly protein 1